MTIKSIVIEGIDRDITIGRTERGAEVTVEEYTRRQGKRAVCLAHIARDEPRESRYEKATVVAAEVYGIDRHGCVAATNSMIHDVLDGMERVAGC